MQMLYVCVLCASCDSSQCCILHDLQFDNAGQGWKRRPYIGSKVRPRPFWCVAMCSEVLVYFESLDCSILQGLE